MQLRGVLHNGHLLLLRDYLQLLTERGFKNPALLLHAIGKATHTTDLSLVTQYSYPSGIAYSHYSEVSNQKFGKVWECIKCWLAWKTQKVRIECIFTVTVM